MTLTLLEPPQSIVSLEEAKRLMRVTGSDDDAVISMLLEAAQAEIEPPGWLGRAFGEQKWRLSLDGRHLWPHSRIEIPYPPLQQIDAFEIVASDGAVMNVQPEDYRVVEHGQQTFLVPATRWPQAACAPEAVTIEFTAGYANADARLKPVRLAISLMASALRSVPHGDVIVRREVVEDIVARDFALNDKGSSIARGAADALLSKYRVWAL